MADVKKPRIDKVIEQPDMYVNWQRIYSKPNTLLSRIADTLFCPRGVSYRWILNNDTIPNVASSSYKPTQTGLYKALVQYPGYPSESKEFNFVMTNTIDAQNAAGTRLYPNPAGDFIYYDFSGNYFGSSDVYHIDIMNTFGKVVFSADRNDPMHKGNVLLKNLPAGYYVIRIRLQNFTIIKGFLHQ